MLQLVDGIRVESLGCGWAAFSPLSGETLLLNAEAAAVVEVLNDGPAETAQICRVLATDSGLDAVDVEGALRDVWSQLLTAGLICEVAGGGDNRD